MTNWIIGKPQKYWKRQKIEAEVIERIKKETPTPTGTESPELTELKKNIGEAKDLLQRIIKITNIKEAKNGLKASYRKDIKKAYSEIKVKMNWNDLDSDSDFED